MHRLVFIFSLLVLHTPTDAEELFLIAHRGGVVDAGRIENNRRAIEEAIRRGYSMLEVDLRESSDGEIVVHHDADFQRYYGDPRRVDKLTWEEIRQLRVPNRDVRPLSFSEFAEICHGRIRLMLDTKGTHSEQFFEQLHETLVENELLENSFVLGSDQSKERLFGKAKVSINRKRLKQAIEKGEPVDELYYLFELGGTLDQETIDLAQRHGVVVVAAINTFRYPADRHRELAAQDIQRLKKLGVYHFQIDSIYEQDCRD